MTGESRRRSHAHADRRQHPPMTEKKLLENWNKGLQALTTKVTPDVAVPLVLYGPKFAPNDLVTIPEYDLPAGTPAWMRAVDGWASRPSRSPPLATKAANALWKRRHILVKVPKSEV